MMQLLMHDSLYQSHSVYNKNYTIKRNEIWLADTSLTIGAEQGGMRPILILSNFVGNKFSPTIICAAITCSENKKEKFKNKDLPTHVRLPKERTGLEENSICLLEQIKTLDKERLICKIGELDKDLIKQVNNALGISMELSLA